MCVDVRATDKYRRTNTQTTTETLLILANQGSSMGGSCTRVFVSVCVRVSVEVNTFPTFLHFPERRKILATTFSAQASGLCWGCLDYTLP